MVDLSVRQFVGAWKLMCSVEPQYAAQTVPGLEMVFSGLPSPFLNIAATTGRIQSGAELESLAAAAKTFAAPRAVPWFFAVTSDLVEGDLDVDAALASAELIPVMKLTGMIADEVAPPSVLPDGLELTQVSEDSGSEAMMTVNSAAYGVDLNSLDAQMARADFWRQHTAVLGSVAGEPATCSAVMDVDGHRYVALVATHPSHQRKGYADSAMRQSLTLAAQRLGPLPTTLHATDAGRPVYARMGYRPISSHVLYLETRFAHA